MLDSRMNLMQGVVVAVFACAVVKAGAFLVSPTGTVSRPIPVSRALVKMAALRLNATRPK